MDKGLKDKKCGMCIYCSYSANWKYIGPLGALLKNYSPFKTKHIPMNMNVKYLLCTNRDIIDDPVAMKVAKLLDIEVVVCT